MKNLIVSTAPVTPAIPLIEVQDAINKIKSGAWLSEDINDTFLYCLMMLQVRMKKGDAEQVIKNRQWKWLDTKMLAKKISHNDSSPLLLETIRITTILFTLRWTKFRSRCCLSLRSLKPLS